MPQDAVSGVDKRTPYRPTLTLRCLAVLSLLFDCRAVEIIRDMRTAGAREAAILISPDSFDEKSLRALWGELQKKYGFSDPLVQVLVSPDRRTLVGAFSHQFPEHGSDEASVVRALTDYGLRVSGVRMDGIRIARISASPWGAVLDIRSGSALTRTILSEGPTTWPQIPGTGGNLRFLHMRIEGRSEQSRDLPSMQSINLYLSSKARPSAASAQKLLQRFSGILKGASVSVVIRTDPWFAEDVSYPLLPLFESSRPTFHVGQYILGPSLRCGIGPRGVITCSGKAFSP
jgi:hypothetical protein